MSDFHSRWISPRMHALVVFKSVKWAHSLVKISLAGLRGRSSALFITQRSSEWNYTTGKLPKTLRVKRSGREFRRILTNYAERRNKLQSRREAKPFLTLLDGASWNSHLHAYINFKKRHSHPDSDLQWQMRAHSDWNMLVEHSLTCWLTVFVYELMFKHLQGKLNCRQKLGLFPD